MKRYISNLFLAIMAMAAFTACSSDDDYQWATASGEQVYFSNEIASQQNISMTDGSFTIPINRVNKSGSITVNLAAEDADGFFTVPSSVSFADGQTEAGIVISYNPEDMVYDVFHKLTLKIASADYTTPYGLSEITFNAGALSSYKSLGNGTLVEDYLWGYETAVDIRQNQENKNVFRIYNASRPVSNGGETSPYLEITICQPGDVIRNVPVTKNDLVYFADYNSGYHHGTYDADVYWFHISKFTSGADESMWLYSKVLAYQEDGTPGQIQLAPYYYMLDVGGWNATQTDGAIIITFPGYAPKDYSAAFSVMGVFTDHSGAVFAEGVLELGADASDARAVVIEADVDADAVADAIVNGDIETTQVTAGHVYIPIPEGLSGKLQAVVAVFDEEGALKGTYSSGFEYYGGAASPWQSLGIGLYTEDFICSVFGAELVTYEVEIEENTDTPGLYRMLSPYGEAFPYNEPGDWDDSSVYNIEVNAVDPDGVYIAQQATGVDWGYGPISIMSWGARYLGTESFEDIKAAGLFGTLKDGIITLPTLERETDEGVAYYQGLTYMGTSGYYGGGNDTFRLVLPEAVPAEARAKARAQAKAHSFAKRLYGKSYSMKDLRHQTNRTAPLHHEQIIAD